MWDAIGQCFVDIRTVGERKVFLSNGLTCDRYGKCPDYKTLPFPRYAPQRWEIPSRAWVWISLPGCLRCKKPRESKFYLMGSKICKICVKIVKQQDGQGIL